MSQSDVELMLRVREDDPDAFELLVERHQRPLINYFYRLTWDRQRSEDLTQEVFMRLYRARAKYSPQARFTTYLYRIAKNLWIDRYRSEKSAPGETSLDGPIGQSEGRVLHLRDRIAAPGSSPEDVAGERELLGALKAALTRLPEDQRQVFVLGQMRGMAYARISEIMEIPEGTVKSRMHAAVRRLRGLLGSLRDDLTG
jgi:RNA polymerase sigma-70 factor (ECF subfamily)